MKKGFTIIIVILLLAWMALITYLSAQPGLEALPFLQKLKLFNHVPDKIVAKELEYLVRKLAHIGEYVVLYILAYLAFSRILFTKKEPRLAKALFFSLVFCFLFAAGDEYHQLLVPMRDGRLNDVLIDMLGIFIGQGLVLLGVIIKRAER